MPTEPTPNVIERSIEIAAPVSRVWAAIADHKAFGEWFGVALDQPFLPGQPSTGFITVPGYEHVRWTATVADVLPERLLSFYWHPYAIDPAIDYSGEQPTLVEFRLEPTSTGTLLTVVESGFDHVPEARRATAYLMNSRGWTTQVARIKSYAE
ncbi:Uncharacterized conserved protein YndB, AHSA1/START domain [Bryocella elongata]|uniref:Uncharacterized conserved protein YndB, AHSA1/START domain n=1 Tax=Bryocella elongata TaxID=863522 RepID=A0A1H6BPX4_9BACT|nr:SRPBCC family protein [Bryocella elongata]SEG62743.1 Uncharacterized conserved protein YndB, AHSA1/START domain [Bryocella elongata]